MRRVALGPSLRRVLLGSLATGVLAVGAPALAAGEKPVDIPSGPLEQALGVLSAQTGDQLIFPPDLVAGRRAPALTGRFTTEQALRRLLATQEIDARRTGPRLVVLKPRKARDAASPSPTSGLAAGAATPRPFADPAADAPGRTVPPSETTPRPAPVPVLEEVQVTGTHIRGGSPAAPVLVLDREALERSGHATVAAALQVLPQNFAGQSTEGTVTTRADPLGTNSGYGSSVNLRGLGSDATLVLVNGRRMAGSGNKGDFADLSGLPAIAVERVEVLLDGASALYGSDAVGGVVNVILRRNLDGGEVRVRGGVGAGGVPREGLVGGVLGRDWGSGNVFAAFELYRREALSADDRSFAATADLRAGGGADRRDTFSFPGNILRTDPVTGASVPHWAIPAGQTWTGLRPGDFTAGTVNRYNQNQRVDILPSQRRSSAYLAWRQDLTPDLELSGDLRHSFRSAKITNSGIISTLSVGRNNPFFVSPNGAASHQIQYAFGELPNPEIRATTESLSGTAGVAANLFGDWRGSGYAAFAQEIIEGRSSGVLQSLILSEALGNTPDNPATAYRAARDGFFNPFAGAPANAPGVLAAIGSGFSHTRFRSRVYSANLQADGSVLVLPAGDLKLAVGAQVRRETFLRAGASYTSTIAPRAIEGLSTDRTVSALYAEARVPLIGAGNRRPGVERLELSGAVRAEHYSDFGRTVNPRVSLQWTPAEGVLVRATYGESYRAPALQELADSRSNGPVRLTEGPSRVLSLALQGGNPDLGPETAKTWTVGLDWSPPAVPGLRLSLNGFSTEFDNRIDRPAFTNRTVALTDPRLAPFVRRISPTTNAADLAYITALLAEPITTTAQGVFPPTDYGAVVDMRFVNTAGLTVRGVDLQAQYATELSGGRVALGVNASRLLDYKQAITPAADFVELLGQPAFPAKFRGRATLDWTRGQLGLGLAVNRLSGFEDALGAEISGQTTLDLQARWTGAAGTQWAGTSVLFGLRNAFNRKPPFYDNPTGFGFDPATADVVGRFASIQLTRSW